MKRIFLLMLIAFPVFIQGQDTTLFKKVPKQISLEAGYRMVSSTKFENKASNGFSVLLDYAWQLSGFRGGRASFISVPIGYAMMFPDTATSVSTRVISYGWTVRHELRPQKGWVPYIGYALMLNNYKEKDLIGHDFGHQTRFTLGLNYYTKSSIQPFVQLDYSMSYYPHHDQAKATPYKFVELKLGARFMKKKKA